MFRFAAIYPHYTPASDILVRKDTGLIPLIESFDAFDTMNPVK